MCSLKSYIFFSVSLFLSQSLFFVTLDSSISQFIWNGKTPKIRKSVLQKPKRLSRLALPNFLFYYWAANIRSMLHWINSINLDGDPALLNIENISCKSSTLKALLCFPITLSQLKYSDNIIVKISLKIWIQFFRNFGLQVTSLSSPICFNPLFPPSTLVGAYAYWRNQGVHSVADLYNDGTFASFDQLNVLYNIPRSHIFRYLQVLDFVHKNFPNFPNAPHPSEVDTILCLDVCAKGSISKLINFFATLQSFSVDSLRTSWSSVLNIEIDQDTWTGIILDRVHSSSICVCHCLIQCKVVHRVHWSKCKLARIDPSIDPECDRCHLGLATLTRMFWTCPALSSFWGSVFYSLSAITSVDTTPSPIIGLFGVVPSRYALPTRFFKFCGLSYIAC